MRRLAVITLIAALHACAVAPVYADDYGSQVIARSMIDEIYDGDTLFVSNPAWPAFAGRHIGVRISGLDTPERHSRCVDLAAKAHEQAQALRARQALIDLLDSAHTIELRRIGRDKYFRILAEVWVDGRNVADDLIARGLAVPYHGEKKQG
jgi:endonuclease YncB( thermonuclease family)